MLLWRPGRIFATLLFASMLIGLPAMTPRVDASSAPSRTTLAPKGQEQPYTLSVSQNGHRRRGVVLDGGNISGKVSIFVTPPRHIASVRFFLNPSSAALE